MRLKTHYKIKHKEYKSKANKRIPGLAKRIFDLRGRAYQGCGFHYSLEASLGHVIQSINSPQRDLGSQIALQVNVEALFKNVAKIEKELGMVIDSQ